MKAVFLSNIAFVLAEGMNSEDRTRCPTMSNEFLWLDISLSLRKGCRKSNLALFSFHSCSSEQYKKVQTTRCNLLSCDATTFNQPTRTIAKSHHEMSLLNPSSEICSLYLTIYSRCAPPNKLFTRTLSKLVSCSNNTLNLLNTCRGCRGTSSAAPYSGTV